MRISFDSTRPGFRNPNDGTEKLIVLLALLMQRPRSIKLLTEVLEKNERQIYRDVQTISKLYPVRTNEYGQRYIQL